jgi:hypothetical protein
LLGGGPRQHAPFGSSLALALVGQVGLMMLRPVGDL